MEKLLHWTIAQQAGDKAALEKIGEPDPKALSQLFGGPDEATLMKESIKVVQTPDVSTSDKEIALENFEMLIENLDNANNIGNLNLWDPLNKILADAKTPVDLKVLICGIIGTAVQNNPKSQEDFHKSDGLGELIKLAQDGTNKALQLKALYAMSSAIRDYNPGYIQFEKLQGWKLIHFDTTDPKLQLRILSLVSSILSNGLDAKLEEELRKENLTHFLALVLNKDSNTSLVDKSLNVVSQLNKLKYEFTLEEKYEIDRGIQVVEGLSDKLNIDDLNAAKKATST
ncbi:Hsp70 nucleotide exchange factor FES1 [Candida viswanathii]|uniref:Hsp70 nucleotide exchange factor FES1 n=1 Tax=Candida viswanathii TaxID=5486 RepID=A0A367XWQ2_9ASCO|nr:Hsp70 nucleotide exchange factor FES1 [Candida viswanathii]